MPMLRVRSSGNLRSGEFGPFAAAFFSMVAVAINSEIRNSKFEIRNNLKNENVRNGHDASQELFGILDFVHSDLFRISIFGLRIFFCYQRKWAKARFAWAIL